MTAALTNNAKIKVVDKAFPSVFGESAPFKITGGLSLQSPSGAATTWTAGTSNTIGWTFTGLLSSVNVYYDLDSADGDQWTPILPVSSISQSGTSGSPTASWNLPTTVTNRARIKIEAPNADPDLVVSAIGADFKIGAQFNITSPENGAPVDAESTTTNITWNTLKGTGINKVKLYYSNNSEAGSPSWIEITPAGGVVNTGTYPWNPIPRDLASLTSTTHRVKITQFDPPNESQV